MRSGGGAAAGLAPGAAPLHYTRFLQKGVDYENARVRAEQRGNSGGRVAEYRFSQFHRYAYSRIVAEGSGAAVARAARERTGEPAEVLHGGRCSGAASQ